MKNIVLIYLIFMSCLYAKDNPILIGNPYAKKYKSGADIYARNIWDIHYFDKKLYLGAGNGSNIEPAPNAGKVPIYSINTVNDKIEYEYKVSEEQVEIYKIINNQLFVPGYDATQNWKYGNFYIKNDSKWTKYRTIPNALHVYDIVSFNNKLFAAIGQKKSGAVAISDDNGKTWKLNDLGDRVYRFLKINNRLLAVKPFKNKKKSYFTIAVLEKNDRFIPNYNLTSKDFFPNTYLFGNIQKITRVKNTSDGVLYLGSYINKDYQVFPFGVYFATIKENNIIVKKVKIPKYYIPRDILVRDDKFYLLISKKNKADTTIKVLIYSINDLVNHQEVVFFNYDTFARSFEKVNNKFYFGMGSDLKNKKTWQQYELIESTGNILVVDKGKI